MENGDAVGLVKNGDCWVLEVMSLFTFDKANANCYHDPIMELNAFPFSFLFIGTDDAAVAEEVRLAV